jgi:hypothetical protein
VILLVCDHKKREMESLKQLKAALKIKNIKAEIINKHCIIKAYNYYKPIIITFPHCNQYLANTINILGDNVKKILLPTEHCAFVEKFLEVQYLGLIKSNKLRNVINKMDYIFSQSEYTKKFLLKRTKLKNYQITNSGHLYYNNWTFIKPKNKKITKIGIALTNEYILRRYKDKNYLKNLYQANENFDLKENYWRLKQMNFDQYYFCLIFDLINKLSKNYKVDIRTHVVDSESNFEFLENKNIKISKRKLSTRDWIVKQDLIISSVSFMNVDSYIYRKPHISLSKLIPNEFYFNAYKTFSYNQFPEMNSFKPSSVEELLKLTKKAKFKMNRKVDHSLKKFFSFPYKEKPVSIISNKLSDIVTKNSNKKFKRIFSIKEIKLSKIIGSKTTILLSYLFSQIKLYLRKNTNNSYFDFLFIFK